MARNEPRSSALLDEARKELELDPEHMYFRHGPLYYDRYLPKTFPGDLKALLKKGPDGHIVLDDAFSLPKFEIKDFTTKFKESEPLITEDAEKMSIMLPEFRAEALIEVEPYSGDDTWQFGWITACMRHNVYTCYCQVKDVFPYTCQGCAFWEIPFMHVSCSGKEYEPWHGAGACSAVFGKSTEPRTLDVRVTAQDEKYIPDIAWSKKILNQDLQPFKVKISQKHFTWLVIKHVTTGSYFVIHTVVWRRKWVLFVSCQNEIGKRCSCEYQLQADIDSTQNWPIPEYSLTGPFKSESMTLTWHPENVHQPLVLKGPNYQFPHLPKKEVQRINWGGEKFAGQPPNATDNNKVAECRTPAIEHIKDAGQHPPAASATKDNVPHPPAANATKDVAHHPPAANATKDNVQHLPITSSQRPQAAGKDAPAGAAHHATTGVALCSPASGGSKDAIHKPPAGSAPQSPVAAAQPPAAIGKVADAGQHPPSATAPRSPVAAAEHLHEIDKGKDASQKQPATTAPHSAAAAAHSPASLATDKSKDALQKQPAAAAPHLPATSAPNPPAGVAPHSPPTAAQHSPAAAAPLPSSASRLPLATDKSKDAIQQPPAAAAPHSPAAAAPHSPAATAQHSLAATASHPLPTTAQHSPVAAAPHAAAAAHSPSAAAPHSPAAAAAHLPAAAAPHSPAATTPHPPPAAAQKSPAVPLATDKSKDAIQHPPKS